MSQSFIRPTRRTVGLSDVALVFLSPRRLFAKVEDVNAYVWPFVVLLAIVTLMGYTVIETGLVDREVEKRTQQQIEQLEKQQFDVVQRSQFKKMLEDIHKQGEFMRMITRLEVVVGTPVSTLVAVFFLSSLFYGIVALTGRKPQWHTLMTIFVYAGFIDAFGQAFRLFLMIRYGRIDVDTTAAALTRPMVLDMPYGHEIVSVITALLAGIDPFAIWSWAVVLIGLWVTRQLRGWRAWVTCVFLWLVTSVARGSLAFAAMATMGQN